MPVKILFAATMYSHLANFHQPFIRLLQGWGWEVQAAGSSEEGRREDIEALGIRCWEIPFNRIPWHGDNLHAYRLLNKIMAEEKFDLVHAHTPVGGFISRYAAHQKGAKVIYTAHGFHFFRGAPLINYLLYYPAEKIAARWTDALLVMNGEDFQAGQRLGFSPGRDLFFTHGVGVSFRDFNDQPAVLGWRSQLGIPEDHLVITCVADLTPRKNQLFLLEAWQILAASRKDVQLVLVGEGRSRPDIEEYIRQMSLPRVHLLGFRRDVPDILRGSDIVTLVSKQEGLPKCLMEAMAAGLPVVATDIRGSRDLVDDGSSGFLVSLGNIDQLAGALEKLTRDGELRRRMGEAGLKKIRNYSLENVIGEMADVYRRFAGTGDHDQ